MEGTSNESEPDGSHQQREVPPLHDIRCDQHDVESPPINTGAVKVDTADAGVTAHTTSAGQAPTHDISPLEAVHPATAGNPAITVQTPKVAPTGNPLEKEKAPFNSPLLPNDKFNNPRISVASDVHAVEGYRLPARETYIVDDARRQRLAEAERSVILDISSASGEHASLDVSRASGQGASNTMFGSSFRRNVSTDRVVDAPVMDRRQRSCSFANGVHRRNHRSRAHTLRRAPVADNGDGQTPNIFSFSMCDPRGAGFLTPPTLATSELNLRSTSVQFPDMSFSHSMRESGVCHNFNQSITLTPPQRWISPHRTSASTPGCEHQIHKNSRGISVTEELPSRSDSTSLPQLSTEAHRHSPVIDTLQPQAEHHKVHPPHPSPLEANNMLSPQMHQMGTSSRTYSLAPSSDDVTREHANFDGCNMFTPMIPFSSRQNTHENLCHTVPCITRTAATTPDNVKDGNESGGPIEQQNTMIRELSVTDDCGCRHVCAEPQAHQHVGDTASKFCSLDEQYQCVCHSAGNVSSRQTPPHLLSPQQASLRGTSVLSTSSFPVMQDAKGCALTVDTSLLSRKSALLSAADLTEWKERSEGSTPQLLPIFSSPGHPPGWTVDSVPDMAAAGTNLTVEGSAKRVPSFSFSPGVVDAANVSTDPNAEQTTLKRGAGTSVDMPRMMDVSDDEEDYTAKPSPTIQTDAATSADDGTALALGNILNSSAIFHRSFTMPSLNMYCSSFAQSCAIVISELERRKKKLQKQLTTIQRDATSRNIFALVRASNLSQLQHLLAHKLCDVNDSDYNGCTALHIAANEGNQSMVTLLVSFGANPMAVDNLGRTPRDWAVANRHSGVSSYLLRAAKDYQQRKHHQSLSLLKSASTTNLSVGMSPTSSPSTGSPRPFAFGGVGRSNTIGYDVFPDHTSNARDTPPTIKEALSPSDPSQASNGADQGKGKSFFEQYPQAFPGFDDPSSLMFNYPGVLTPEDMNHLPRSWTAMLHPNGDMAAEADEAEQEGRRRKQHLRNRVGDSSSAVGGVEPVESMTISGTEAPSNDSETQCGDTATVDQPESTTPALCGEDEVMEEAAFVDDENRPFSSYSTISDTVSLVVCMVGLPGRGKSFISKRIARYLNWKGVPCRVFNAGNYRRQLLGAKDTACADFYDPSNESARNAREKMAELACEDLVRFICGQHLAVGILDATNTTKERRCAITQRFMDDSRKHQKPMRVIFIESVCTDEDIITENILRAKCGNGDFKNVADPSQVIEEFRERIHQYEKVYESLHDDEGLSYMKIINVKHHVVLHKIPTGLGSRIAFFLLNLHPVAFPIYIALPGTTEGDVQEVYAGDERLTEEGEEYAMALKDFIRERYVPHMVVLHATNRSVINTLQPAIQSFRSARDVEGAVQFSVESGSFTGQSARIPSLNGNPTESFDLAQRRMPTCNDQNNDRPWQTGSVGRSKLLQQANNTSSSFENVNNNSMLQPRQKYDANGNKIARSSSSADSESSAGNSSDDSDEMAHVEEIFCPVPGIDNINYGRFAGQRADQVRELYPRLSQILFTTQAASETSASASMVSRDGSAIGGTSVPNGGNGGKAIAVTSKCLSVTQQFQHIPTGTDPRLSYCVQFPNGESCRQVNVRLEPALMAVMRCQSPVFVIAPEVPAQGLLSFFTDLLPELAPTLRLPRHCVVEIGVKGEITVHHLLAHES